MFNMIRPPRQSYQVATECGEPSRRMVAMTAGFARERKLSHSRGSGIGGIAGDYPAIAARRLSQ